MDMTEVKELLALFDQSTVREFELTLETSVLRMSKNEHLQEVKKAGTGTNEEADLQPSLGLRSSSNPISVGGQAEVPEAVASQHAEAIATSAFEKTAATGKTVNSPIVGVTYLSSAPDQPQFKTLGDRVEVGETLCIVEAMKLMNEITSDIAGTITEILIENEQVVEYGQPLFRIV